MTPPRSILGLLGNTLAGLVLLALAAWLSTLHGAFAWSAPAPARGIAAALLLVGYGAMCVLIARRARASRAPAPAPAAPRAMWVIHASQTGQGEQLALRTAQALREAGLAPQVIALGQLGRDALQQLPRALFIASTTGEGDAPDGALRFLREVWPAPPRLDQLHYGLLALGDSSYANYCAFGRELDGWLRRAGAQALFDRVEVDAGDAAALRHWQHHLGVLSGRTDLPDWTPPRYQHWRLRARERVNAGSAGAPCWRLELVPAAGALPSWRAGDLVEVAPCAIDAADLATLPHREYSIASIPAEGVLLLLVRSMSRADGSPGLGSHWLTHGAAVGGPVALRIRGNANFHAPDDDRPLLLVGNGTGIAGLRALLAERIARGQRRNWLVFGERNAAHDYHFRADIERWHAQGGIERLDLAFSRDPAPDATAPRAAHGGSYVQHRLLQAGAELRAWIAAGASIHVCGSLQGMAPGVHAALLEVLGAEAVEQLVLDGRYRRDVY